VDDTVHTLLARVERGEISLTALRVKAGSATWKERWAYRLPYALGWLHRAAATSRLTGHDPRMVSDEQVDQLVPTLTRMAETFGTWCAERNLLPNEHALWQFFEECAAGKVR
jgi:hypothetical protein